MSETTYGDFVYELACSFLEDNRVKPGKVFDEYAHLLSQRIQEAIEDFLEFGVASKHRNSRRKHSASSQVRCSICSPLRCLKAK